MADIHRTSVQFEDTMTKNSDKKKDCDLKVILPIRKISSASRFQVDRVNSVEHDHEVIELEEQAIPLMPTATEAETCPSPDFPSSPSRKSGYDTVSFDSGTRSPTDTYYSQTNNSNSETHCKTFGR